MSFPWASLVRYRAIENGPAKFGEPICEDETDFGTLAQSGQLQVKVLEGSGPFSLQPTDQVERVHQLLGPLEPNNVPIIRCIGLNYKSHSTRAHQPLLHF
jgi:hypothetical protein